MHKTEQQGKLPCSWYSHSSSTMLRFILCYVHETHLPMMNSSYSTKGMYQYPVDIQHYIVVNSCHLSLGREYTMSRFMESFIKKGRYVEVITTGQHKREGSTSVYF